MTNSSKAASPNSFKKSLVVLTASEAEKPQLMSLF
jgi:hypothetical protein